MDPSKTHKNEITLKLIVSELSSIDNTHIEKNIDSELINYPTALSVSDTESPSQFSEWLKSIFIKWENSIQRIGILGSDMYSAILYCVDPKFETLSLVKQKEHLKVVRNECHKEILNARTRVKKDSKKKKINKKKDDSDSDHSEIDIIESDNEIDEKKKNDKKIKADFFQDHGYKKLGWKKSNILTLLKNGIESLEMIRVLVDYLCVNIFIIDSDDKQIQVHYGIEQSFCPFKETIFLIRTKTGFDPIVGKDVDKKTWNYNDIFFREFINTHKQSFTCPTYSQKENIDQIRDFKMKSIRDIDDSSSSDDESLDNVLNKNMKLEQLQKYAKKFGISTKVGKKQKAKQLLYEEIKKRLDDEK